MAAGVAEAKILQMSGRPAMWVIVSPGFCTVRNYDSLTSNDRQIRSNCCGHAATQRKSQALGSCNFGFAGFGNRGMSSRMIKYDAEPSGLCHVLLRFCKVPSLARRVEELQA